MFGPRYFGPRYFGPRYFGDGGSAPPAPQPSTDSDEGIRYKRRVRGRRRLFLLVFLLLPLIG